ncbi:MAG TPA: proton-conducting transporter membrane subunit, partial [Bacteroidales bacterium]|nr:proton-conducting transporter membrane subunit [Bacteroidales bacterium]
YGQVLLEMMPLNEIVLWLAAVGMIFGSVIAIVQSDLKRMLAYSSIAQIGYVFLGIGLYHNLSLIGGLYHVLVHAVMKPLLFMSAGAIIYSTGVRHVKQLAGIGRVLPIVMLAFAIGGASMIGIPGTGGLISKWYLVLGSLDVGRPIFVAVILLSSLLNAGYFLPIIVSAFMHEETTEYEVKPVPRSMLAALIAGAAAIILLGVASRPVIVLLEEALLLYF